MQNKDNVGAVLHSPKDIRLENVPIPTLGDNDVLLAIGSVGICGSDIKYWSSGKCGRFILKKPMVMGHEASGTVIKIGNAVKNLKEGDRVAIEPGVPCRYCRLCKSGRYNLCPDIIFCATPPDDGNLCRFFKHPADFCFKLPDHVTLDEGAMIEPLAVAVYSCRRASVTMGTTMLICGAGPVGILVMLVAKQMGATHIILTDIDNHRLSLAKEMGADYTINVHTKSPEELAQTVVKTLGYQPDVTIECSGTDFSFITGMHATFPGGNIVLVGRGSGEVALPMNIPMTKEVDIKGIFRYANCYPAALDYVASGLIDLRRLVSHRFPLQDTAEAFQTAVRPEAKAIKIIIDCNST